MQGRAEEKPGLNFDLTRWRPYRDRVLFMIHRTYCGHRMGRWGHKKPGTWPGFHHLVAGVNSNGLELAFRRNFQKPGLKS